MPSPHEFAGLVIRALRNQGETRPIRYDPSRFSLIIGEESSYHSRSLSHLYDEYCVSPWWRRKEVLSRRSFSGLKFLAPPGRVLSAE